MRKRGAEVDGVCVFVCVCVYVYMCTQGFQTEQISESTYRVGQKVFVERRMSREMSL